MEPLTHIDLFSGIGGFALACHWNGIRTEVFCERDERCRRFLERTWPGIPIVPDVREFDGTKWTDRFILTAGVPCQPTSRAGKQRGKEDDRWLWPEALRIVSEARPDWCLFENPLGLNDVGLDGILADLEGLDYEVAPPLIIPACAVNSPQLRNRYWIVAHSRKQRGGARWTEPEGFKRQDEAAEPGCHWYESGWCRYADGPCRPTKNTTSCESSQSHMADTAEYESESGSTQSSKWRMDETVTSFWDSHVWLPCADGKVRRAPDDIFGVAHGLHRSVLAGLGNSIVPQVAAEIIKAIKEAHHGTN